MTTAAERVGGKGRRRAGRGSRGRRVAAEQAPAELPDILRALGDEHRYQLRLLKLLEKQVAALNLQQEADYEVMYGVMRYMTQYPDRFHHPKEDLVFDKVVRRDPASRAEVNALLEAHVQIIAQGAELLELIERSRADPDQADTRALRKSAHAYIGGLRRHMDIEMLRVFPRAQQVLRPEDWVDVDARMKPILDPVFGETVAAEFQTLRDREEHRPAADSPGRAHAGLIEAAALIESLSSLIAGATRANTSLARHHRDAWRTNVGMVRDLLGARPLERRIELAGEAFTRNVDMARGITRRMLEVWSDTWQAARRPYQDEGPHAARLFRPCARLARSGGRSPLEDARSEG